MARIPNSTHQPASTPTDANLATRLDQIASSDIDAARSLWCKTFRRIPPAALSHDMLARMVAYRLQEQCLGGLAPGLRKLLDRAAQGSSDVARRLKIGTTLVREHQGVLHEVKVVAGGFEWQGADYASLSTIARAITGTAWNGPRFFGLRGRQQATTKGQVDATGVKERLRTGRRGSVRSSDEASAPSGLVAPNQPPRTAAAL